MEPLYLPLNVRLGWKLLNQAGDMLNTVWQQTGVVLTSQTWLTVLREHPASSFTSARGVTVILDLLGTSTIWLMEIFPIPAFEQSASPSLRFNRCGYSRFTLGGVVSPAPVSPVVPGPDPGLGPGAGRGLGKPAWLTSHWWKEAGAMGHWLAGPLKRQKTAEKDTWWGQKIRGIGISYFAVTQSPHRSICLSFHRAFNFKWRCWLCSVLPACKLH